MSIYHEAANVILLNKDGNFILQKRDDKPGILSPGMITAWGGAVEAHENPIEAAMREITEETNLMVGKDQFEPFGVYLRNYQIGGRQVRNHIYLLRDVDEHTLEVFEGQGYEVIDPRADNHGRSLSDLTKEIIADYLQAAS